MPLSVVAVNPNCNYEQLFETGVQYYMFNSEYPNNSPERQSCAWHGRSYPNTIIVISCVDITIPKVIIA